ncbi:hypothetical protein [Secundilactobacillus similis]|uniref:hypothetical protein n=1 Tax=Secundilactobacillus similis TaxID=414682 RepID=UPI0006D08FF9|nr:hypothetical protein [Secundilactobacillus similis]
MIQIINATSKTDFDAVRELYYETWQAAYAGLLPASFLAHLTKARWHPETQWRTLLLAVTETGQIVGVCRYGKARLPKYSAGVNCSRFTCYQRGNIKALVPN